MARAWGGSQCWRLLVRLLTGLLQQGSVGKELVRGCTHKQDRAGQPHCTAKLSKAEAAACHVPRLATPQAHPLTGQSRSPRRGRSVRTASQRSVQRVTQRAGGRTADGRARVRWRTAGRRRRPGTVQTGAGRGQGVAAPPRVASTPCQGDAGRWGRDAGRSGRGQAPRTAIGALASASSSLCWMRSSRPPTQTRMPPRS